MKGGPVAVVESESVAADDLDPQAAVQEDVGGEATFEPATRGEGDCVVTVSAVLEAAEYRGAGPMTPALEASLSGDPEFARMYASESHGDHHIQCWYEVRLASKPDQRFRWREVHGNTLRELTTQVCNAKIGELAETIVRDTEQCRDLDAKAYWGSVLEPF